MVSLNAATWSIAGLATFGVIARPWNLPEFIWAVAGAALLVLLNLLPWPDALAAAAKGNDVYLFLIGMMLLAEVARKEGLFDWLAAQAVQWAKGSAKRLFLIVYVVGTAVTVLLSNDATAVVLTPAVYAATRAAKVEPLPYLFICAFIANAASFVLPISNPANLVVFGTQMPPLSVWLHYFMLPSACAIAATYITLRLTQRRSLDATVAVVEWMPPLTLGGKLAAAGIALTAVVLLGASALGRDLGLPTFVAGATVTIGALLTGRKSPTPILKDVSWSVLPDRRAAVAGRNPEGGRDGVSPNHFVDRRSRGRRRVEPRQQPPDGTDGRDHEPSRAGAGACHRRNPDRGRSRAKPLRHRLACHHTVADRAAPRRRACRGVAIPQARPRRHAARAAAGAACPLCGVVMSARATHHQSDRAHSGAINQRRPS